MATYYLDTSALAKRYTSERGRQWMRRLTVTRAGNDILLSVLGTIELEVALARKTLETAISPTERDALVRQFQRHLTHQYETLPISDQALKRALEAWCGNVACRIRYARTTPFTRRLP